MDRRVGMSPLSASELPFAEFLCAEAFVDRDDRSCVPRQIAALLQVDYGMVAKELAEIEQRLYGTNCMDTRGVYWAHGDRVRQGHGTRRCHNS